MQSSPSQIFQPFADDYVPPRSRTTAASIWAPKQQETETTWPPLLDGHALKGEKSHLAANLQKIGLEPFNPVTLGSGSGEDVFGPLGSVGSFHKKEVGAIGDGRKRQSPPFDDTHVEQLLRSLNLSSPAPFSQQPVRLAAGNDVANTGSGSPDLSPSSTTSTLLTPSDLSPAKAPFELKLNPSYDVPSVTTVNVSPSSLLFDHASPVKTRDYMLPSNHNLHTRIPGTQMSCILPSGSLSGSLSFLDPYADTASPLLGTQSLSDAALPQFMRRADVSLAQTMAWRQQQLYSSSDWLTEVDQNGFSLSNLVAQDTLRASPPQVLVPSRQGSTVPHAHEPINFLSLLHPSSSPPYNVFVARIIKSSDQQASIFLQQKLKVADVEERHKIVDAICARGFEMMSHRFGNWAVQRCLEAAATPDERRKIVACMRGRVVELSTNCYGCHVLQKALDCEEDIRLMIVKELLHGDPALTLTNKHASHVWSKIMELTWTPPAPPIFAYVNKSLKGKWASLACHETGSLVVQHAFENLEEPAKDGIIEELLNQGAMVFADICKNQWGSYCIQHILEHGSPKHRQLCLDHLMNDLLDFATNEQGFKSVMRAFKDAGSDTLERMVKRMCDPAKGGRRAMIVDLALSVTGSQLIASVLPQADKDQRALLYDCIRGHIVTLRGCKTGSKVIWLLYRAYYGY
ncbi:armadillo-type protein [Scleroderma yunnanense]